jgi:hypothetical protein
MDSITMLMIGAGVAALVIIGAVAIWRSRNETIIQVPTAPANALGALSTATYTPGELADMSASGKLVEVTHPLVMGSMEQALARGGPMTRYVVRYQEKLWMTFEPLPEPQERALAYDLFRRWNAGEEFDMKTMLAIIGKIGK